MAQNEAKNCFHKSITKSKTLQQKGILLIHQIYLRNHEVKSPNCHGLVGSVCWLIRRKVRVSSPRIDIKTKCEKYFFADVLSADFWQKLPDHCLLFEYTLGSSRNKCFNLAGLLRARHQNEIRKLFLRQFLAKTLSVK